MGYVGQAPAAAAVTGSDITDGTIANVDIASDAAIALSKTALSAGTGLTLSTNTLNVDAAQTGITSVGTIATGTWEGTTVAVDQGGTGATTLNNLITLATHSTGDYVQNITAGTNLTSTGATSGENIAHSLSVDDAFLKNDASDTTTGTVTMAHLIVGDGGNIGSASDTDAIAISSGGDVTFSQDVLISDATYVKLGGTRAATIEPAANQTGYGVVVMFDSAGSVSLGDAVFINTSGKVAQANAVTGSVTNPAIGIALNAGGSDGDDVYVLTHGVWRNDDEDFSSSVGSPVYLGESVGAITKTAPSTDGDYVQRLGIAISDDCMLVMPSVDVIEHA